MGNLSSLYNFNFAHARCFFSLSTAQYISRVNWAPSVREAAPWRNLSPQIWTRHAALPDIRDGSHNKNISKCLGVNLRAVQRLVSLMVITKVRQLRNLTLLVLIRKISRIRWRYEDHDWQRSLNANEGHSQRYGSVWVYYHAYSAWRHSVFTRILARLSDNFSVHITPD